MAGVLTDKAILVTGASTGIGRATALRAAQEGARVMVADVNTVEGPNTVAAINEAGGKAVFIETDVTQSDQVRAAIAATVEHFGSLDGAFNNAGIEGVFTNITRLSEEDYDRTMAVNAKGVWLCVKYEIEQMLQSGGGSIVSTASVAGIAGTRGASAYAASKHAVVGITKTAALEMATRGIRVNCVCPGVIETPMVERLRGETGLDTSSLIAMQPIGRTGDPREIGEAVVWLLSDQSSFVTGVAMPVDGGYVAQ